jgi:hypothetical protein
MWTQEDLVDQLFNSSEKRLARILLLMLSSMNRFRQHGFIEYSGRIRVHKSLLNVILNDQFPGQNSISAPLVEARPGQSEPSLRRAAAIGIKVRQHDGLKD